MLQLVSHTRSSRHLPYGTGSHTVDNDLYYEAEGPQDEDDRYILSVFHSLLILVRETRLFDVDHKD